MNVLARLRRHAAVVWLTTAVLVLLGVVAALHLSPADVAAHRLAAHAVHRVEARGRVAVRVERAELVHPARGNTREGKRRAGPHGTVAQRRDVGDELRRRERLHGHRARGEAFGRRQARGIEEEQHHAPERVSEAVQRGERSLVDDRSFEASERGVVVRVAAGGVVSTCSRLSRGRA